MQGGWKRRLTGGVITALLSAITVLASGSVLAVTWDVEPATVAEAGTMALVVSLFLAPIYAARPFRFLERVKYVFFAVLTSAGVLGFAGYAGIGVVPEPAPLLVTSAILVATLPFAYAWVRDVAGSETAVVVGDDPAKIRAAIDALDAESVGYLSPSWLTGELPDELVREVEQLANVGGARIDASAETEPRARPDGGIVTVPGADRIAGLSRLEHVLLEQDVDTVALAFTTSDREEFFGSLRVCHQYGVDAKVHESHAPSVLVDGEVSGDLVDVDLEPWPWYSRLAKRGFDIAFATAGLVALAPLMTMIAIAIKLDSPGPVLYSQTRSAELGGTFGLQKFRTMLPDSEVPDPGEGKEVDRITRVGMVLRRTHMDEIPQLFAILEGHMSVVGPRAVWVEEEEYLQSDVSGWPKRWTVKPGLTGLAQVKGVDSEDGPAKFQYDLDYIRRRSMWLDVYLVALQIWMVMEDLYEIASSSVR